MFAYCLNNPISYIDNTGDFPLLWLLKILLKGAGAAISALISGGAPKAVVKKVAFEMLQEALAPNHPEISKILSNADRLDDFIESLYAGNSLEESLFLLGIDVAAGMSFPSTGDELADFFVDGTFGFANQIIGDVLIFVLGYQDLPPAQQKQDVNNTIIQIFFVGSVGGSGCGLGCVKQFGCSTIQDLALGVR